MNRTSMTSVGPLSRWLADLGLGYRAMLAASIGGLVWLAATRLTGMNHDVALLLSLVIGVGGFVGAYQFASRGAAARVEDKENGSKEVKP